METNHHVDVELMLDAMRFAYDYLESGAEEYELLDELQDKFNLLPWEQEWVLSATQELIDGGYDYYLEQETKGGLRENPSWVADHKIWEKAKKAVKPYWNKYDQPWAVVAHTYRSMGGKVKKGKR